MNSSPGVTRHPLPRRGGERHRLNPQRQQLALPPAAVVLTVTVFSVAKRGRWCGPPALGPVPDNFCPPNGCTPTTAPIWLRLT